MYGVLRWCSRSRNANTTRFMSLVSRKPSHLNSTPSLHKCAQKRNIIFKMGNETPHRVVGYYVVFPHIPEETVENNRFMYNIAKVPAEERTFETVVEPLLTEEYDVDYALQTLLLKMMTDWPECDRKLFDADLHHDAVKVMFLSFGICSEMAKIGQRHI
ncbi:hypothetical protein TELCIR_20042 [Teladorsagia circumcincta]|uniref:Uncharacterized protein n=1 Tax=Teladorsagia circumcincta TaxID=45464 RepID=A0A2G9TKM7_TELCI|nr:hypothetical protein TELCIR_20042 [Teladorsagia circumcincta]